MKLEVDYPGKLIVLEGGDCTGKGKQIKMLLSRTRQHHGPGRMLVTEEPWRNPRSPNGLLIDRLLNADHLGIPKEVNPGDGKLLAEEFQTLYFCDRFTHWAKLVYPALKAGKLVICDRERMSTYAYGYAFGLTIAEVARWHELLPPPDLTIWISIPTREAIRRKRKRIGLTEHFEDPDSMKKIGGAYREVFKSRVIPNVVRVSGLGTPEDVHSRIWEHTGPLIMDWRR